MSLVIQSGKPLQSARLYGLGAQLCLSLFLIFGLIGVIVGPTLNLLTDCDKHQALCDKRKAFFGTMMYWALAFLVVYLFMTGQVFNAALAAATVPVTAATDTAALGGALVNVAKITVYGSVSAASSVANAAMKNVSQ